MRKLTAAQKIAKIEGMDWNKIQCAGIAFREAIETMDETIAPTAEELASLILLTARLLEFCADVRGTVHDDTDSLSYAS